MKIMKNSSARLIADCALGVALSAVLMLISAYVPFLSFISLLACGSPMVYIVFKHNAYAGVLAALCTLPAAFIALGNIVGTIMLMLLYIVPSLVFAVSRKKSGDGELYTTLALTAAACAAAYIVMLVITRGDGGGIQDYIASSGDNMRAAMEKVIPQAGIEQAEIRNVLSSAVAMAVEMVMRYLPSIVIGVSAVTAYMLIMFNVFLMKRLRAAEIHYPGFYELKMPRSTCFVLIIFYIIDIFTDDKSMLSAVCDNLSALLTVGFAVCGLSFADYYFRRRLRSGYLRAAVYAAVGIVGFMLMPFVYEILIFVGFFDGLRNIRGIAETRGDNNARR
ncbi:MAG: DUF2232 domain-containing protein [Monoglobaceae bacterium]